MQQTSLVQFTVWQFSFGRLCASSTGVNVIISDEYLIHCTPV